MTVLEIGKKSIRIRKNFLCIFQQILVYKDSKYSVLQLMELHMIGWYIFPNNFVKSKKEKLSFFDLNDYINQM